MKKICLQKYAFIIIPLFFLFYSAPSALDYLFFHADEKRYTDAVIHMMDKDEYLTPFQADGETPRFKKPIVTYWALMSGVKLFGVSPFGARFFFWIAGALLVAVTFFMANSLMKNRNMAILAAVLVAANPLVMMSASRTIPDILLVLFLTISAWGFLEILTRNNSPTFFYWMAYLGAALAFETKGIPVVGFVGVSMLFLLLNPWAKVPIKKLIHLPSMGIAAIVSLAWFATMYIQHGMPFLESFFDDQVGNRVSSKMVQVATNGLLGIVNLVLFSIPWIFIAWANHKQIKSNLQKSNRQEKAILGFALSWVLLIVLMSASVFKFYDRYILPCIPLLSIVLAWGLYQSRDKGRKLVTRIFSTLNILVITISLIYSIWISRNAISVVGLSVAIIWMVLYFAGFLRKFSQDVLVAHLMMLTYFMAHTLLYAFLMPVPARQLAEKLQNSVRYEKEPVYVYGHIGMPANIRVQSHGTLHVVSMGNTYELPDTKEHIIVFKEKEKNLLKLDGYELIPGSEEFSGVPVEKFPKCMQPMILRLKEQSTHYFIGKPQ